MVERIVEIELGTGKAAETEVPEPYKNLSGRGLISAMLLDEIDPACDPLGKENMLIFTPGLLAGTLFSSSNRLSAGAKSPLTGGIKEANAGGMAAHQLGKLKIRAIKIKGTKDLKNLIGIKIDRKGVTFEDLSGLRGKGTYESAALLKDKYGKHCGIMVIGPAGEMKMSTACINVTDKDDEPCRNLGRGGLGAVMGSKGIKAIIIDDSDCPRVDSGNVKAKELTREFAKQLREHPVTGEMFPKFGTVMTLMNVNGLGGLPTRNFSRGEFEHAENLSGQTLNETITARGGMSAHACMPGCVIRCSNRYADKDGNHLVGSVDFETVCLLGSNLELQSLDQVVELNYLCNDIGVDTMETGVALGVLCEAGAVEFGNYESIGQAIESLGKGEGIGQTLGAGAAACGKAYNVTRVPVVKNQGMAAYDPRIVKGMGITYALSPMGADHTAGNAITLEAEHTDPNGKVPLVRDLHINTVVYDSLGVCIFTGRVMNKNTWFLEEMLKALRGWDVTFEELRDMAKAALKREIKFNRLAGIGPEADRLPEFMRTEKLSPNDMVFEIPQEEMEELYNFS